MNTPRITEAELRELYEQNRGLPQSNTYSLAVMQLVAEVRRLRGIIAHYVEGLDRPDVSPVEMVMRGQAVIAEGRAIHEEQGK